MRVRDAKKVVYADKNIVRGSVAYYTKLVGVINGDKKEEKRTFGEKRRK